MFFSHISCKFSLVKFSAIESLMITKMKNTRETTFIMMIHNDRLKYCIVLIMAYDDMMNSIKIETVITRRINDFK